MVKKKLRVGMLVEYQRGFSGYNLVGHLIRPLGKIIKILDKEKMIVKVKNKEDGVVTTEVIGETVLFP